MGFFSELDKAKNDVKVQPQKKRKTLGDASNKPDVLRRSSRDRRQVDYSCGDDVEFVPPWKPSFKSKVRGKENLSSSPSTSSANSCNPTALAVNFRFATPVNSSCQVLGLRAATGA